MSVKADADLLLALGEYDAQCDDDFKTLQLSMFGDGMPEVSAEGVLEVSSELVAVRGTSDRHCLALTSAEECLQRLALLLRKWSSTRQSEECDSIGAMIVLVTLVAHCCNAAANQATCTKLGAMYDLCSSLFADTSNLDWSFIAKSFSKIAVSSAQPEDALSSLCDTVRNSYSKSLTDLESLSGEVENDICELLEAADRCEQEIALRKDLNEEARHLSDFFACLRSKALSDDGQETGDEQVEHDLDNELIEHVIAIGEGRKKVIGDFIEPLMPIAFLSVGSSVTFNVRACEQLFSSFRFGLAPKAIMHKFMQNSFVEACATFAKSVGFISDSFAAPTSQWQKPSESAVDMVDRLWGSDKCTMICNELLGLLQVEGIDLDTMLTETRPLKAAVALRKLAKVICADDATLVVPGRARDGALWSYQTLDFYLDMCCHASQLLYLVAWLIYILRLDNTRALIIKIPSKAFRGQKDLVVNPMLPTSLAKIRELTEGTWPPLKDECENQVGIQHAVIAVHSIGQIVECVKKALVAKVESDVITQVVERVATDTAKLQSSTPRWTHIASSSIYNPTLAKKQLLGHPAREQLPALMDNLQSPVDSVKEAATTMSLKQLDPTEVAEVQAAQAALEHANEALAVIAATSIVEEVGANQKRQKLGRSPLERGWASSCTGPLEVQAREHYESSNLRRRCMFLVSSKM